MTRRRILVTTSDTIGPRMAGPAIRAWHLAESLAADHEVELVTTGRCESLTDRFSVRHVDERALHRAVEGADVVVSQGWFLAGRPWIVDSEKVLVCDIYDPLHLEQLEHSRDRGDERWRRDVHGAVAVLNEQLRRGDFFICASEKQRSFWLGQLAGLGRINPATYGPDPTLRSLIDVVPFGTSDDPPRATHRALRGVLPGIDDDSKIALWGGGIYNWFDPLTLIHAVHQLLDRHPELRLVFMGVQHPNPDVPRTQAVVESVALADKLGLTGSVVHFNEGWVPFAERQNMLLEADVGVSMHFHHLETEFSFRTRILDYLWASLPMVITEGDAFADLVRAREAGLVVPPEDVDAVATALDRLLSDRQLREQCSQNSGEAGLELRWSSVTAPLGRFCAQAARAPDLEHLLQRQLARHEHVVLVTPRTAFVHNLRSAARMLRDDGAAATLSRTIERTRHVLRSLRRAILRR